MKADLYEDRGATMARFLHDLSPEIAEVVELLRLNGTSREGEVHGLAPHTKLEIGAPLNRKGRRSPRLLLNLQGRLLFHPKQWPSLNLRLIVELPNREAETLTALSVKALVISHLNAPTKGLCYCCRMGRLYQMRKRSTLGCHL